LNVNSVITAVLAFENLAFKDNVPSAPQLSSSIIRSPFLLWSWMDGNGCCEAGEPRASEEMTSGEMGLENDELLSRFEANDDVEFPKTSISRRLEAFEGNICWGTGVDVDASVRGEA